jgi:hypothetical protein
LIAGPALLRVLEVDSGAAPLLAAVIGLLAGGLLARQRTRSLPAVVVRLA